jgi:arylsulfatase A-like enzyme
MVERLDAGVGSLVERLARHGLSDRTLVIFTSDNGGERFSDMGPLRDSKFSLWEGGIRVAAMARWPGVIPEGRTTDQVAITMDWTRTALGVAGANDEWTRRSDGVDLLPTLRGGPTLPRTLFWRTIERTHHRAVRSGWWKYLRVDDAEHLFDLEHDPGEARDRAAEAPTRLASLRATYTAWEREMVDPSRSPPPVPAGRS